MKRTLDLNSDLGEWEDPADSGSDAAMFEIVSSANLACGFHAGDAESMLASLRSASEHGVSVGAHPSYRDREGFGRRDREIGPDALRRDIFEQLDALAAAAGVAGVDVRYVKPHGALYNRIVVDPAQADAVALVAAEVRLPILGLAGSEIHRAADRHGAQFFREAFVDRAYQPDGSLVPRGVQGAVITDPVVAAARAVRMAADGVVEAIDGTVLRVELDSLCVHGDTPGAVAMAGEVRDRLLAADIDIRAFA